MEWGTDGVGGVCRRRPRPFSVGRGERSIKHGADKHFRRERELHADEQYDDGNGVVQCNGVCGGEKIDEPHELPYCYAVDGV